MVKKQRPKRIHQAPVLTHGRGEEGSFLQKILIQHLLQAKHISRHSGEILNQVNAKDKDFCGA